MAPPETLEEILTDFSSVDVNVVANLGRRVRFNSPRGVVLIIGKRWREIPRGNDGRPVDEGARLASLLCCPEDLKFVGSVIPADSDLVDRRRTRLWPGRGSANDNTADSDSGDAHGRHDADDGIIAAAMIAAAAVLAPSLITGTAVYARDAELPAYRQAPELYVSSTGKVFVYLLASRTDALACVASSVHALVKEGIQRPYLPVRRPIVCRGVPVRELTECRTSNDVLCWRERNLANKIILGDKSEVSTCDQYFVGLDAATLERYAVEADANTMDVIGLVCEPLLIPPLTLLTDDRCRVYAVQGASVLILIADDYFELVERGIDRYHRNILFMSDPVEASLVKVPECPNNLYHGRATNGVPPGSNSTWREKKSKQSVMRRAVGRVIKTIKRK
nr:tegument protein UL23 [Mastomys natalensis cytomegalovirus 3]WEG69994.1 tegument protein UL23 [Mastomys natalensis cytomegalovirus 3]WEG70134.1 tegument protein UL23 [Mastomys natalensis cytomegalovirus 3]WEG70694.1 tegument protein UL23 [Mastomys natalensis cytomegalovirus 3]